MFSKIITTLLAVSASALISTVNATPLPSDTSLDARGSGSYSLNNWQGISSLNGFDNWYGSNNFDGSRNTQTVVEYNVVCHTEEIEIIQQRLTILREMMKRIITEQICEVETQTIILSQHQSNINSFSHDLYRNSGNWVGYDRSVASKYGSIVNSDGSLSNSDLGFSGQSVGSNYVAVQGNNWGQNSENTVNQAGQAAAAAYQASSRYA